MWKRLDNYSMTIPVDLIFVFYLANTALLIRQIFLSFFSLSIAILLSHTKPKHSFNWLSNTNNKETMSVIEAEDDEWNNMNQQERRRELLRPIVNDAESEDEVELVGVDRGTELLDDINLRDNRIDEPRVDAVRNIGYHDRNRNWVNPGNLEIGFDGRPLRIDRLTVTEIHNLPQLGFTTRIKHRLFEDCVNLWGCTIPDTVKSIGYNAFANCVRLRSIVIPSSVTVCEDNCFCF